jgi:hypothetical protein
MREAPCNQSGATRPGVRWEPRDGATRRNGTIVGSKGGVWVVTHMLKTREK